MATHRPPCIVHPDLLSLAGRRLAVPLVVTTTALTQRDAAVKEKEEAVSDLNLARARASKLYEGCSRKDEAIAAQVCHVL